jgi:hypothetical protein
MQHTHPIDHLFAADEPELVRTPEMHYISVSGSGAPGTDEFYRKKALITDIARAITGVATTPVIEIQYWYPEGAEPVDIADFYTVNPVPSLHYRVNTAVPPSTTDTEVASARATAASPADVHSDDVTLFTHAAQDVVQVMHHGPFAEEYGTLKRLGAFATEAGVHRNGPHHEIHLDAFTRHTPQDTLRTILRDPVARITI